MNEDIIQNIDNKVNKILNGTEDLLRFNQSEHAGVCSAGPLLIGALFVCDIARESIEASGNAGNGQTPAANWEIDERQEQYVQRWAAKKSCWIPEAEAWLQEIYGKELARGAEAKVFCKRGDTHVVKLRTSIYATLGVNHQYSVR